MKVTTKSTKMPNYLFEMQRAMRGVQIPNHLLEAQKALDAFRIPNYLSEVQNAMKAFEIPNHVLEAQKALNTFRIPDYISEAEKAMRAFEIPSHVLEAQRALTAFRIPDYVSEAQKAMRAFEIPNHVLEAQNMVSAFRIPDYISEAQKVMKAFQIPDHMLEAQKAMKAFQMPDYFRQAQEVVAGLNIGTVFDAISQEKWSLAYETDISDFYIDGDGNITVDSEKLSYSELQEIINHIVDKSFEKAAMQFERCIAEIISEIRSLKNPAREKLLTWLIFPIIVGLIFSIVNPIADYYIKSHLDKDKKQAAKEIKKYAINVVEDSSELKNYRLVTRDEVNVREKPSFRSKVDRKIYFGQVVIFLAKKRDWALVAWSDDSGELLHKGWIPSKYMSKLAQSDRKR